MLIQYDLEAFSSIYTLEEIPMTKLFYHAADGWTTVYVPNDRIKNQILAWDEQGVDYSFPA